MPTEQTPEWYAEQIRTNINAAYETAQDVGRMVVDHPEVNAAMVTLSQQLDTLRKLADHLWPNRSPNPSSGTGGDLDPEAFEV